MIQYLIVYAVVAFAVWNLVSRMLPKRKKKGAASGKSCSACAACDPADAPAPDWMAASKPQR